MSTEPGILKEPQVFRFASRRTRFPSAFALLIGTTFCDVGCRRRTLQALLWAYAPAYSPRYTKAAVLGMCAVVSSAAISTCRSVMDVQCSFDASVNVFQIQFALASQKLLRKDEPFVSLPICVKVVGEWSQRYEFVPTSLSVHGKKSAGPVAKSRCE